LDHKNFSVWFFYKRYGQTAPVLGFCRSPPTENIEKNFSAFQLELKKQKKKFMYVYDFSILNFIL